MQSILTFSPQNNTSPIIRTRNGKPKTQKELSNDVLKAWTHRTISNKEMAIAVFDTYKPTRTQMLRASFLLCKAMETNLVERIERGIYRVLTQNEEHVILDQFLALRKKYRERQEIYLELINKSDELGNQIKKLKLQATDLNDRADKLSEQMNDIDTEMLEKRKQLDSLMTV